MTSKTKQWTKEELKIYILILCANIDSDETEDEINLVKSKTTPEIFEKMYQEFKLQTEQESIDIIEDNIHIHNFTEMELAEFRQEIYKLFLTDSRLHRKEQSLDKILDNILY